MTYEMFNIHHLSKYFDFTNLSKLTMADVEMRYLLLSNAR